MVIFDCNGVLVDSEPIAAEVLADELTRAGFVITAEVVAHYLPAAARPIFSPPSRPQPIGNCRPISPPWWRPRP